MTRAPSHRAGITLLELLVVIGIIALLAGLLLPVAESVLAKARSTECASNLRQVGMAVHAWATDHGGYFPRIESDPAGEVKVYDEDQSAKGLVETLKPYGLEERFVQCPTDLKTTQYYQKLGSSYEWRPIVDGEQVNNPKVYGRMGAYPVPASRIRICVDYERIHHGQQNRLYADGHVRSF